MTSNLPSNQLAFKLRSGEEMPSSSFASETEDAQQNLFELMQKFNSCENVTTQDVAQWVTADDSEEESTIEELTTACQRTRNVDDDKDDDI
ncbi:hypothetical protein Trydic_g9411 [Trypoxylus dichotomus]